MITKAIAMGLRYRQELHHRTARMADGKTPQRCRVNGQCKTWKTRPEDFQLPVKQGLKDCGYITPFNGDDWCLSVEEALAVPQMKLAEFMGLAR